MNVTREMPKYECNKKVWALKIKHICLADNNEGAELTPEEDAYAPFFVSQEYMDKHKPEVGGYYVVYDDGYKSFSPAGAFESGYTRLLVAECAESALTPTSPGSAVWEPQEHEYVLPHVGQPHSAFRETEGERRSRLSAQRIAQSSARLLQGN